MTEGHPTPGLLEAFMRSEVAAPDRLRIVRHLLSGCPQCVAVTRHVWSLGELRPLATACLETRESPAVAAARRPSLR